MPRLTFALFVSASVACHAYGMTITKSNTPPPPGDLLLGFDTTGSGSQNYFTMDRGGGYESAYGQTFEFDTDVLLDKITFKVRTTQSVDRKPLLLWLGTGFTGVTQSGLSSIRIDPVAELPTGMGASGSVWYLTLDIADQAMVANQTYAFMPRFASGSSGGNHAEMELGFMGAYSYDDGAAYTFGIPSGYRTILNNEMVFFLHGSVVPDPGWPLAGDYNGNGEIEQNDLDFVLLNWGDPWTAQVPAWGNDQPSDGVIDQDDLDRVLINWGNTIEASASVVPEPTSAILMLMGIGLGFLRCTTLWRA